MIGVKYYMATTDAAIEAARDRRPADRGGGRDLHLRRLGDRPARRADLGRVRGGGRRRGHAAGERARRARPTRTTTSTAGCTPRTDAAEARRGAAQAAEGRPVRRCSGTTTRPGGTCCWPPPVRTTGSGSRHRRPTAPVTANPDVEVTDVDDGHRHGLLHGRRGRRAGAGEGLVLPELDRRAAPRVRTGSHRTSWWWCRPRTTSTLSYGTLAGRVARVCWPPSSGWRSSAWLMVLDHRRARERGARGRRRTGDRARAREPSAEPELAPESGPASHRRPTSSQRRPTTTRRRRRR